MTVRVQTSSTQPIYEQLYTQIKAHIINGVYEEGYRLPSIRAMARETQVSVITVKKAYEDLERDEFIYAIPNKGYYVKAQDLKAFNKYYFDKIDAHISDIKAHAETLNLSNEDLLEYIKKKI